MANIKQIAKRAGVSVATVSRVLNNVPYVAEDKRKAVLEAAEQLNYSRNLNAVHLLKGRTNTIGIMLPKINHAYFSRLMEGISSEALRENYNLMCCQTGYKAQEEMKVLDLLKTKQVDGIIICSKTIQWADIEPFTRYGPIIACEDAGNSSVSSIYHDHYASFRMGLDYLIRKGHKHIGFCVGRDNSNSTLIRKKAYADAIHSIHEPVREEWMFYHCYSIENGVEVAAKISDMDPKPTALLVTGDQVAAGIIMEARKKGMRIPEDLAVIGFDNQPIAQVFDLTTIDNRLFEMGAASFRIFHDQMIGKRQGPLNRKMEFRLVERSTV